MPPYKVTAINLKVSDFGEADKLVTIFSRERGKLKVLAKGSRKVGSKLSGRTDLLVKSRMLLATGRHFEILTDAQIQQSFAALRTDLKKLNLALYFLWLVEQISPLSQPSEKVFELLEENLNQLLLVRPDLIGTQKSFETGLARLEGVSPAGPAKNCSLKKYFEAYLDRIYPAAFYDVVQARK